METVEIPIVRQGKMNEPIGLLRLPDNVAAEIGELGALEGFYVALRPIIRIGDRPRLLAASLEYAPPAVPAGGGA